MTREEAQALAEREVLEYARGGRLARTLAPGEVTIERGFAVLVQGMADTEEKLFAGKMHTGVLISLAALCIELLRECHLKEYNGGSN